MPYKLLLADDSVTIQRVIELTFADEDVQVIAVGNGQLAIERAERERPDIVLADVGMPERDGYEVAAYVKSQPSMAHVPVVLLTGAFEPIDETRARSVGCDGVLVKPFEPQMVISRVKDLLSGKRPSNMWNSGPSAQGPLRAAAPVPPAPEPLSLNGADPLEAYFDRLDAAFSAIGATTADAAPPTAAPAAAAPQMAAPEAAAPSVPPAPRASIPLSTTAGAATPAASRADDFASWDPDLSGDAGRPAASASPSPSPMPEPFLREAAPAPPRHETFAAAPALARDDAFVSEAAPPPHTAFEAPASLRDQAVAVAPAQPAPWRAPEPPPSPAPAAPALTGAIPSSTVRFDVPSLAEAFGALLTAEQQVSYSASRAAVPGASPQGPADAAIDDALVDAVAERVLARLEETSMRATVLDAAERLVREEIDRLKQISS